MEEKKVCPGCCHKTKDRPEKEYKDLMNRLSRIEGQVRGVRRMVEEGAYCPDILIQVSAVNAALNSFNKVLLANHIRTCVADDIRDGKDETIDELVTTQFPSNQVPVQRVVHYFIHLINYTFFNYQISSCCK